MRRKNVMAAAWACALDFSPPKVTVVLDKATRTRELVEASGEFALQLPTVAMAAMTVAIGTDSAKTHPDKLQQHGVELFHAPSHANTPLVQGCAAWLLCRVIPEPHHRSPTTSYRRSGCRLGDERCSATGLGVRPAPDACARCITWRAGSFMDGASVGCRDRVDAGSNGDAAAAAVWAAVPLRRAPRKLRPPEQPSHSVAFLLLAAACCTISRLPLAHRPPPLTPILTPHLLEFRKLGRHRRFRVELLIVRSSALSFARLRFWPICAALPWSFPGLMASSMR